MRRWLLAVAMFGMAQGAQAADMPDLPILRGAVSEGLTSTHVNWQGFYVGAQGAWGTANMNLAGAANNAIYAVQPLTGLGADGYPTLGRLTPDGSAYGGFVGYNWQFEDVVLGLDGTYLHGNFKGTSNGGTRAVGAGGRYFSSDWASVEMQNFGSVRGRAGYMIGSLLPYATFGGALGNAQITGNATTFDMLSPTVASITTKQDRFVYGYSAGLGVDMMVIGCMFMRLEYEYQRLMTQANATTPTLDIGMNTFRAGVGYKF